MTTTSVATTIIQKDVVARPRMVVGSVESEEDVGTASLLTMVGAGEEVVREE